MKVNLVIGFVLSQLCVSGIAHEALTCSEAKLTCTGIIAAGYGPDFLVGDFSVTAKVSVREGTLTGIANPAALEFRAKAEEGAKATLSCGVGASGPFLCGRGVLYRGETFLAYASAALFRGVTGNESHAWLHLKYEALPSYDMKSVEPVRLACSLSDCKE